MYVDRERQKEVGDSKEKLLLNSREINHGDTLSIHLFLSGNPIPYVNLSVTIIGPDLFMASYFLHNG